MNLLPQWRMFIWLPSNAPLRFRVGEVQMELRAQTGLLPGPMLMRMVPAAPFGNQTGAMPAPCERRILPKTPA